MFSKAAETTLKPTISGTSEQYEMLHDRQPSPVQMGREAYLRSKTTPLRQLRPQPLHLRMVSLAHVQRQGLLPPDRASNRDIRCTLRRSTMPSKNSNSSNRHTLLRRHGSSNRTHSRHRRQQSSRSTIVWARATGPGRYAERMRRSTVCPLGPPRLAACPRRTL